MKITSDVKYVGVNDYLTDLFEGQYIVPNGMAYNSYVILDEKITVMDSVDVRFYNEWLDNIENVLNGKKPDYLVVSHMEPDHSSSICNFMKIYPSAKVVANSKIFTMMKNFFGTDFEDRRIVVNEGDVLNLGKHVLNFVFAPMVHWPEVMMTYDSTDKILFSADGFGKFGAIGTDEEWACEARRYYFGIVGKYGAQVKAVLKKAESLDIQIICPLHGPVLSENLSYYINLYNVWASYEAESDGVAIFYTSVYGNTKKAVDILVNKLYEKGCPKVSVTDLARSDMAEAVEDAFKYGKIVLATTTYNNGVFPYMQTFLNKLTERLYQKRTIGIIENGSWAPTAGKVIKEAFAKSKEINFIEPTVSILSSIKDKNVEEIDALSTELCKDYENTLSLDKTSTFKIGYGLYVGTTFDGKKDNGFILNTVSQISENPTKIMISINKQNYSYHLVKKTGKININCLTVNAPFTTFQNFGFNTGRNTDKFNGVAFTRSTNGLAVLTDDVNAYISLKVEEYIDTPSHGTFICSITESKVLSDDESMTYAYYHKNVKPSPKKTTKKGFSCKICGYFYEGDTLPADFTCPWCKHPASDFEPLEY